MTKELNDLYVQMLMFSNSPKSYRDLKKYYEKVGMKHQSQTFANLLETRFQELPNLDDYNPNTYQK
jgi:hypothetical protein